MAARKVVQNGAFRAIAAMAAGRRIGGNGGDGLQFGDLFRDSRSGALDQAPNLKAGPGGEMRQMHIVIAEITMEHFLLFVSVFVLALWKASPTGRPRFTPQLVPSKILQP